VCSRALSVVFRVVKPGVMKWVNKVETKWVPEEKRHSVVVERSFRG
jgi:hypothetical protein